MTVYASFHRLPDITSIRPYSIDITRALISKCPALHNWCAFWPIQFRTLILKLFLILKVRPKLHLAHILPFSCFLFVCSPSFLLCMVLAFLTFSSCLIFSVLNFFLLFSFLIFPSFSRLLIKNEIF